jgi:hypothetical protein
MIGHLFNRYDPPVICHMPTVNMNDPMTDGMQVSVNLIIAIQWLRRSQWYSLNGPYR